jgi:inorganic pyrophosphatase
MRWRAHPWHGVPLGDEAPVVCTAYIEVVPGDYVKFELDKETGHLKIDRPQKFSNVTPTMYGLFPQTHCGARVAEYAGVAKGDGDPLDVCVLTERPVSHGDFIVKVVPIGGFRMIDRGEADDKILAYVQADEVYSRWRTITDVPAAIVRRLQHYFTTYKVLPGEPSTTTITAVYGREDALEVIRRSMLDYRDYLAEHR